MSPADTGSAHSRRSGLSGRYSVKSTPSGARHDQSATVAAPIPARSRVFVIAFLTSLFQNPQTYEKGQEVYRTDETDGKGNPVKKRYWICCSWYNSDKGEWEYRLKDGPPPQGKWVVDRISENNIEPWD